MSESKLRETKKSFYSILFNDLFNLWKKIITIKYEQFYLKETYHTCK